MKHDKRLGAEVSICRHWSARGTLGRILAILPILAAAIPAVALAESGGDGAAPLTEPPSIIRAAYEENLDRPVSPDLIGSSITNAAINPIQPRPAGSGPCATVFGYLPYWESAANLRYDLLTHLACFSVDIKADGNIGNLRGWPWTATINAAHANGVKVVLVATLFNSSSILTLITTPENKARFFANMKAQMLAGKADGLNIDFEGNGTWRSHINGFMADLTAYMHAEIPGSEITFAGPAVNWSNAWNLAGLADSCDGIFIMGYAFNGSWSTKTGPEAPLTGGSINITNTVTVQYAAVTQNAPEKLILGIPYYGEHWTTTSPDPRATVIAYQGSTRFRDTATQSQIYGELWDDVSKTPWYRWHDGTNWHQIWADNAHSLGLKYQLAQDYNLQGVGMWALNYDGTRHELWDELDRRFLAGCSRPADFDNDGDVDLEDYGWLQRCLSGREVPQLDPTCQAPQLDEDSDVDEDDAARFINCFTGPGVHAGPACTRVP